MLDQQAGRALLEELDPMSGVRRGLRMVAERDNEWAGIPMPMEGHRLVIEPTYPNAEALSKIGAPPPAEPHELDEAKVRNEFYSHKCRCVITIFEHKGKIDWGKTPAMHHFRYDFETLRTADAWSIECESSAIKTLSELVSHRQFKHYMLTGMILETSKRSGVHYIFRRLRPTIALRSKGEDLRILCALCLHPIAYYAGSWGGSMVPTDDVIAHLMLMRGDEPMFWRRANQHAAWTPEAGL